MRKVEFSSSLLLLFFLLFSASGYAQCNASFTNGAFGHWSYHSNTSTGNYASALWSFSDGTTDNNPNSTNHNWTSVGTHTVCLSLFDAGGNLCDSICQTVIIDCYTSASYSVNGLTVTFNGTYQGAANDFIWYFGDGNSANGLNVQHTYSSPGTYWVGFQAYDSTSGPFGTFCDSVYFPVTVTGSGGGSNCNATADFTVTAYGNQSWCTNNSTGNYAGFYWAFSDGTIGSSASANHFWSNTGTHSVCLYLLDSAGAVCDSACEQVIISCIASATYSINGLTVSFNGSIQGGVANDFIWFFGDGNSATGMNVVHTYASPGTYWVGFQAYDSTSGPWGSLCDSVYFPITVTGGGGTGCNATASFTQTSTGLQTTFNNTSTGNYSGLYWVLSDGSQFVSNSFTHTWAAPGTYQACLFLTDSSTAICDSACQTIVVNNPGGCQNTDANFSLNVYGNESFAYNSSTGNYASQLWTYSDGSTDTSQNGWKFWNQLGSYWVCLSLFDASGNLCDSMCANFDITCLTNATYTVNGLTVQFTGTYQGTANDFIWFFGDGNQANGLSVSHTYASAGTYWVGFQAYDSTGGPWGTFCDSVYFPVTVGSVSRTPDLISGLEVYPNPASDQINIRIPGSPSPGEFRLCLFDVMGKMVMETELMLGDQPVNIDLGLLSRGLYHLRLIDEHTSMNRKIILE